MAPHAEEVTTSDVAGATKVDKSLKVQTNGMASEGPEPSPGPPVAMNKRSVVPSSMAPPKFDDPYKERDYLKTRLAAAFRIFGKYGFDEGVAGHITVRDPVRHDCFWVNPFGNAFSLINKSDLILVDEDGNVLEGGENRLLNKAAFMIHSAIHKARPDVNAAAHSHSIYGRTFCTLGRKLDTITQDACAFHNDHVVYQDYNGVVLAEEEGKNIAACLGAASVSSLQRACCELIANHFDRRYPLTRQATQAASTRQRSRLMSDRDASQPASSVSSLPIQRKRQLEVEQRPQALK